ncbi:membrane protein [Agaricicola taiwanensis]|uniref:Membrane protein n=1 Tax=Agaricicola taiwanensis TaxID=591372 RepID=A0A8J2VMF3_9RHOB|nr:tripartite tricarboxylate transporter TctB family protein [Agaricicola taiwanensis]GGE31128.1 membrane protein [Agaricicola taiwanensis]
MGSDMRVDRILGVVILMVAAAVAIGSFGIEYSFSSDPLGPRAFPLALAIVCALCALWLLARPSLQTVAVSPSAYRSFGLVAVCVISAALFPFAGFRLSIFLLCSVTSWLFGASMFKACIVGVLNAIVLWLAFTKIFGIALPPNPLLGF